MASPSSSNINHYLLKSCRPIIPYFTNFFPLFSRPQENYDNGNIKTKLRRPVLFPEEFARFEYHMGQPVRMHNIRKRMLKDAKNANEAKIEAIMTSVLPDGRQVRGVNKY